MLWKIKYFLPISNEWREKTYKNKYQAEQFLDWLENMKWKFSVNLIL